jgi:RNA polymerase sigma-70 factor (ECF subfamily)
MVALPEPDQVSDVNAGDLSEHAAQRTDLRRAMSRLRPRERALLWLAYGQGHAHAEIAETLGVKTASVKLLLFRARRKLATLLRRTNGHDQGGIS